jgi:GNAT superfamily N-acetyltransferase
MIVESVASIGVEAIGARAARQFETAFRRTVTGAVQTTEFFRLVTGEPHPMGNLAIVSRGDDLAAALEATRPLLESGRPAAAMFPAGAEAPVREALHACGFAHEAGVPVMAVDIDALAPTTLSAGYEFRRVGPGRDGEAWTHALAEGYGLPHRLAQLFDPAVFDVGLRADAPVQHFAVARDGRTVATSMLYLEDGLAGVYNVATLPEERKRGLGAHATAEALRVARRLGYRVGVLQSSSAGYGVYLALGFVDYRHMPMLLHLPS